MQSNLKSNNNKTKNIFIIIGIIVLVVLLIGIISVVLFFRTLGEGINKGIDSIKENIDAYEEKQENREKLYDNIVAELFNNKLISDNLKFIDYKYGWEYEWVDKTNKNYVYIDSEKYDMYKKYWLEDVDISQYDEGYNKDLSINGDYVFQVVNISEATYSFVKEFINKDLSSNKDYYLVKIYNNAIYYEYKDAYGVYSALNIDENSIVKEYIFYQENDKLLIEEIVR